MLGCHWSISAALAKNGFSLYEKLNDDPNEVTALQSYIVGEIVAEDCVVGADHAYQSTEKQHRKDIDAQIIHFAVMLPHCIGGVEKIRER